MLNKTNHPIRLAICSMAILIIILSHTGLAAAPASSSVSSDNPIVIVVADKLNSLELYQSKLPAVRRFLAGSSCGLMGIRSGGGYFDSKGGCLSLSSGERSTYDLTALGASVPRQSGTLRWVDSYLGWSREPVHYKALTNLDRLTVSEMRPLYASSKEGVYKSYPGLLGDTLHRNGWRSCLLGNSDTVLQSFNPAKLLAADFHGYIDEGDIAAHCNLKDTYFPGGLRFNTDRVLGELKLRLARKKLIVIEYGDFYRLDHHRTHDFLEYPRPFRAEVWGNFDRFLNGLMELQRTKAFSVVIIAPSLSQESRRDGCYLAPILIRSRQYPPGLITSGTTKWVGLVSNHDFLPTIAWMAGLKPTSPMSGRVIVVRKVSRGPARIIALANRFSIFYPLQRPLLDAYMWIISISWIGWLLLLRLRQRLPGHFLINAVMAAPLALILLPVFPASLWGIPLMLLLTAIFALLLLKITDIDDRILLLSGLTWAVLVFDQITGWRLIRFSALGYGAVDGSRYYGMGNEYMGIFLAASLILAHLLVAKTGKKWPVWLIFGTTMSILYLPQLGAKFGGMLSGSIGMLYYLIRLYQVKLNNKRLWLSIGVFLFILLSIGVWDSLRPPQVQTHIGRFIHLLVDRDTDGILQIVIRKLNMNIKLTRFSPWMRFIWLALAIGLCVRWIDRRHLIKTQNTMGIWQPLLVTGVAAYLLNDAGVLALATCLAFGFSFILLRNLAEDEPVSEHSSAHPLETVGLGDATTGATKG